MGDQDFIQSSVLARVLEKKLLKKEQFQAALDSENYTLALQSLRDTVYGKHMDNMKRPQDYESVLDNSLADFYQEVESFSPSKELIDLFTLKYTYHNFKAFLKGIILKEDLSHLYYPMGRVDMEEFQRQFESGRYSLQYDAYGKEVNQVMEDYNKFKNPQRLDMLFDRFFYYHRIRLAKKFPETKFEEYARHSLDFTNIKTMFRIKIRNLTLSQKETGLFEGGKITIDELKNISHESIPDLVKILKGRDSEKYMLQGLNIFEESGQLSGFDKSLEDYQISMMEKIKRKTYGPDVLFYVILNKEIEVRNLRIVLAGKLTHMEKEKIMKRLRDMYV